MADNYEPVTPEGKFFKDVYEVLVPLAAHVGDLTGGSHIPLIGDLGSRGIKLFIRSMLVSKDNYIRALDESEPDAEVRLTMRKLMEAGARHAHSY